MDVDARECPELAAWAQMATSRRQPKSAVQHEMQQSVEPSSMFGDEQRALLAQLQVQQQLWREQQYQQHQQIPLPQHAASHWQQIHAHQAADDTIMSRAFLEKRSFSNAHTIEAEPTCKRLKGAD